MTLISANMRAAVEQRAGHRCEYCLLAQATQVATFPVDHIHPVAAGGLTILENLAYTCPRCNAAKWTQVSGHDAITDQTVPLFHPRMHIWSEHFRWSDDDPTLIEPLTPTGRVTITLLDLNGSRHLQIRRWLVALEMHPPSSPS